jgi:hypothetical protein
MLPSSHDRPAYAAHRVLGGSRRSRHDSPSHPGRPVIPMPVQAFAPPMACTMVATRPSTPTCSSMNQTVTAHDPSSALSETSLKVPRAFK